MMWTEMLWTGEALVGLGAALISVLGALMTYLISTRQTRVNVENLKFSNDTAVIAWANRVVSMMSEGQELAKIAPRADAGWIAERQVALAFGLSALVDEGRWYFPNHGKKDGDEGMPTAYRGHRQAILDHIVAGYDAVQSLAEPTAQNAIGVARRNFVSDVQQAVDPSRRQWVMERFRKY
jgi:hypothetical protein